MVKLKRVSASLVLAGAALGLSPSAHAGIPVFDGANVAQAIQQVLNWAKQLEAMKEQFGKLQEQLDEAKAIKGRLEGIKSLGSILDDPAIRSMLPEEMRDASKLLTQTSYSAGRTETLKGLLESYGVKTKIEGVEIETAGSLAEADRLDKLRQMIDSSNKRAAQITQLGKKLDKSADAKESMDLVGRNALEIAQAQVQASAQMAAIQASQVQEELRRRAAFQKQIEEAVTATRAW